MTEVQFNSAIAIYNPNGGHRTGKIYNVRDIGTFKSLIPTDTAKWQETFGTVSLGELNYQLRPVAKKITKSGTDQIISRTGIGEKSGNTFTTYSVEVKKGTLKYFSFWMSYFYGGTDGTYYFDLDTGVFVNGDATVSSEDLGDGWYRLIRTVDASGSNDSGQYGFSFTSSSSSIASAAGDYGYFSGVQAIENDSYQLAEDNPSTDLSVSGGGGTRINKEGKVENVIYNIISNSNAIAGNANATVSYNAAPAPTGEQTATKWELITAGSITRDGFNFGNVSANGNWSIYIKQVIGNNTFNIYTETTEVNYTLTGNGSYSIVSGNFSTAQPSIENIGDGWYRIAIPTFQGQSNDWYLRYINGSIGDILYLWGMQLTLGSHDLLPLQIKTGTAAFPKIDYSTGQAAFLIEPTRTNYMPYSYNLLADTGFSLSNGVTASLNQVGITGESNTALLIEDNSTTNYGQLERNLISLSGRNKVSVWIKKDSNQSRFPEIVVQWRRASDASTHYSLIQLNTATGEFGFRAGSNYGQTYVLDRGLWWEVVHISTEDVDRIYPAIRPAMSSTLGGTYSETVTGSIILGHFGIYNSTAVNGTPIITNGVAVTRSQNIINIGSKDNRSNYYNKAIYAELEVVDMSMNQMVLGTFSDVVTHYRSGAALNILNGEYHFFYRPNSGYKINIPLGVTAKKIKVIYQLLSGGIGARIFINGTKMSFDTQTVSGYNENINALSLGSYQGNEPPSGTGHMRFYDVRVLKPDLTDQEAIALTTL